MALNVVRRIEPDMVIQLLAPIFDSKEMARAHKQGRVMARGLPMNETPSFLRRLVLDKLWFWVPVAPLVALDLWSKWAVFSFFEEKMPEPPPEEEEGELTESQAAP